MDAQSGSICLDILTADKWSAVLDVTPSAARCLSASASHHSVTCVQVRALLVSLRSLLSEPNNDSPLNNQAALLYEPRALPSIC